MDTIEDDELFEAEGPGETCKARRRGTGERVNIQLLARDLHSGWQTRLERDLRRLESIDSPHVMRCLEVRLDTPRPFLVWPWLEARSLEGLLREAREASGDTPRFPLPGTLDLALQIAAGLAAAHRSTASPGSRAAAWIPSR